jgi:amino acid transporter
MQQSDGKNNHSLGLFSLVMIAVVSVDSLRNLPISAQYGFSLVSFYLFAALSFFIPLAWIAAKLAARHPSTGGSYVWIEKAFGSSVGHLSVWLQWVYNIIWYPTIFAFINSTLASLLQAGLETNKWFIFVSSLGFFWILSILHCFGIGATRWISIFGAIVGTLLPMAFMIGMTIYWLGMSQPSATPFSWHALLPNDSSLHNLGFFSNILFSLLGLEVIAMHGGNVSNPKKTYPLALSLSAVIILSTIVLGSLSLCIIMPADNIPLINGLMNVFDIFFSAYHFKFGIGIIGICIIIGGLAIASSWMIGLARGLQVALASIRAPAWLHQSNKNHMPSRILLLQAVIYSVLLSAFLLFPDINSSYWILSALTAQFALLYYILLFAAAIKLLNMQKFSILLSIIAILTCLIGITVGFLPPEKVPFDSILKYELLMASCFVIMIVLPIVAVKAWQLKRGKQNEPVPTTL